MCSLLGWLCLYRVVTFCCCWLLDCWFHLPPNKTIISTLIYLLFSLVWVSLCLQTIIVVIIDFLHSAPEPAGFFGGRRDVCVGGRGRGSTTVDGLCTGVYRIFVLLMFYMDRCVSMIHTIPYTLSYMHKRIHESENVSVRNE